MASEAHNFKIYQSTLSRWEHVHKTLNPGGTLHGRWDSQTPKSTFAGEHP